MTDFWLVRHGQTDWNLTGRWQGQSSDAPSLNETGRQQALVLLDQLKHMQFSAIYSSDLLRSRQTAELIANRLHLGITLESRLREMNLGAWEGMLSDEIKSQYPQEMAERACNPLHARAPGGESAMQVAKRVMAAVGEIGMRHCDKSVLIIAHGISLAIVTCLARGIPLNKLYEYVPDNATLNRVKWKTSVDVRNAIYRRNSKNLSVLVKGQA
jgi:broad specificity phosphatase PhoE